MATLEAAMTIVAQYEAIILQKPRTIRHVFPGAAIFAAFIPQL